MFKHNLVLSYSVSCVPCSGICTTEGETWQKHRDFFHQQMRHFVDERGKGSQGFIEVIMDEIDDIKIDLAKKVLPIALTEN